LADIASLALESASAAYSDSQDDRLLIAASVWVLDIVDAESALAPLRDNA
jgi:hypothetical protein